MIALVNYGLGNVQAFANIYHRLNIPVIVARSADELRGADRIILPGVGAFDWAMDLLNGSGMRECLDELVMEKKRPVLGICVGMQIMARRSDEGVQPGLGWIEADVKRFEDHRSNDQIRLPHMGWNDVEPVSESGLFSGGADGWQFYFLHSYYWVSRQQECVLATTDYHGRYASAVRSENIYGVQFHPEKSHRWGIQLLKNFAEF